MSPVCVNPVLKDFVCVIRLLFQHEENVDHFVRLKVGFVMASGSLPAVGSALALILIRSLLS